MTTTGQREWESSLREQEQTKVSVIPARGGYSVNRTVSWKESSAKLARAAYGSSKKQGFTTLRRSRRFTISKVSTKVCECFKV
jgi:hypothetical protein